MDVAHVNISVPQGMTALFEDEEDNSFERNAMMLYPYIKRGVFSHGRTAEMMGVSKLDLIEFYNGMGIAYLSQSPEEVEDELGSFHSLRGAKE